MSSKVLTSTEVEQYANTLVTYLDKFTRLEWDAAIQEWFSTKDFQPHDQIRIMTAVLRIKDYWR